MMNAGGKERKIIVAEEGRERRMQILEAAVFAENGGGFSGFFFDGQRLGMGSYLENIRRSTRDFRSFRRKEILKVKRKKNSKKEKV